MDQLTGAAVAAAAAIASIAAAAFAPLPRLPVRRVRLAGAGSLGLVGLALLGAPVPSGAPLVVLAAGLILAFAWPGRRADGPSVAAGKGSYPSDSNAGR